MDPDKWNGYYSRDDRAHGAGFTLIELLVVIAIISLLASIVFASLNSARDKGRIGAAILTMNALKFAPGLYNDRMGFYPPDTGRGKDPGFVRALPWDPETGSTLSPLPGCPQCPVGWDTLAQQLWDGPYISSWPKTTPWGGKYDYNYWPSGAPRYPDELQSGATCQVPPGIYIGIQGDYSNGNTISRDAEKYFLNHNLDGDHCLDGEVQVLVSPL